MQWHNKNCCIWVFFTSLLLSPLFAFISYLNYLRCLYYQQKVMVDAFSSNKQCNSIWEFMDWSLCMMFQCMLYLCFGTKGFQSMSRAGCKQVTHRFQSNLNPKISDSHALRPLCKVNQSSKAGVIKRFISKEQPVRTKILNYLHYPSPISIVLKWKMEEKNRLFQKD